MLREKDVPFILVIFILLLVGAYFGEHGCSHNFTVTPEAQE